MRFMPVVVRYFRDFLRKTKSPQPAGAKPGPQGIRYDTLSRIFHKDSSILQMDCPRPTAYNGGNEEKAL